MMMEFARGERSNNVGDSLDFEVSQQVVLHPPPTPPFPSSLRLSASPPFSVSLFQPYSSTHIAPPSVFVSLKLCASCLRSLHDSSNEVHTVAMAFRSQSFLPNIIHHFLSFTTVFIQFQNSLLIFNMHCSLN